MSTFSARANSKCLLTLVAQTLLCVPFAVAAAEPTWSDEDRKNLAYLFESQRTNMSAHLLVKPTMQQVSPETVQEMIALNTRALMQARLVRDDVLAKMHPLLRSVFRTFYETSLELFLESVSEENDEKSRRSAALHGQWVEWWDSNRSEFQVPK